MVSPWFIVGFFNYILFWIILFLKSSSIGKGIFFPQILVKYTWHLREKKKKKREIHKKKSVN